MTLKFFTQEVWIYSLTYWNFFKGKWETRDQEKPSVKMTADISIDDELSDNKVCFQVTNKMWDDPAGKRDETVRLMFYLTHEQVIHIHSFLGSVLKNPQEP